MTDWNLIAKARDIKSDQMERHIKTLKDLEVTLGELKRELELVAEPAPVFSPIVSLVKKDQTS
jgi:hypothetical protein